jgi:predicted RNA-binding Zn-ribbon protein involved in translation (DUF1610 family)
MAHCPVCQSVRIVIVVSPTRRAFCTTCGSRWIQDCSAQREVRLGQTLWATAGRNG